MSGVPPAELIYSRTVDTDLGPRYVHLYWGDLLSLLHEEQRSVAVIGASCYQGARVTGQVWRALTHAFPYLEKAVTDDEFRVVLEAGTDSSLWPMSEALSKRCADMREQATRFAAPAVLVCPDYCGDESQPIRRVFVMRSMPVTKSGATIDDYRHGLSACFSAIRGVESQDILSGGSPYAHLVLSLVPGRGFSDALKHYDNGAGQLLQELVDMASKWLAASPRWRNIDIALWDARFSKNDVRGRLIELLGDETRVSLNSDLLRELITVLKNKAINATQHLSARSGATKDQKRHDKALLFAMRELTTMLEREEGGVPDFTVTEFGTTAGRLAEGMVNWLCVYNGMTPPNSFEKAIESLAMRRSSSGKARERYISRWFKSYLHTLRVLRNESAHSQAEDDGGQFPPRLDLDDITVLAASLNRVLSLHATWMDLKLPKA